MAITVEARSDLISIVVGMFNAAPGAAILSDLTVAFEAGQTRLQIATNLAKTAEYLSIFPEFMTNAEFATKLVDNMLGSLVNAAGKAEAVTLLTAKLNAANTSTPAAKAAARADASVYALDLLKAVPTTDGTFGAAAAALANKVEVATFYSVNEQQNPASVLKAQEVIEDVDNTAASVTTAKSAITGEATVGQTYTLGVGVDAIVGTSFNDTINALSVNTSTGVAAETVNSFDSIDGGNGTDTLNIYTTATENEAFPTNTTVKNVEIVNINNSAAPAALGDASKFTGVEQLWQIGGTGAAAVTNLGSATTAGFKSLTAPALAVTPTSTATSANIALSSVGGAATLTVNAGTALNAVNISGSLSTGGTLATTANVGATQTGLALNTAVATTLTTGGAALINVDASASTGAITYSAGAAIRSIKTGAANDTVTTTTTTSSTAAAVVETGDGNDTITVTTTGTGTTTVNSGAGNDTINLNTDGSGKTTINAGAGNDKVVVGLAGGLDAIAGTDVITGGDGTDTISVAGPAAYDAEDYIILTEVVTGFETLELTGATVSSNALDASKLTGYTTFNAAQTALTTFTKVAATQSIVSSTTNGITASAVGYAAPTGGATVGTLAGTLNITSTASNTITANAETVNLTVSPATSDNDGVVDTLGATTLTGDAKVANVTLVAKTDTAGTSTVTTDDVLEITTFTLTTSNAAGGMDGLTTLTLTGNGTATVTNAASTALVTVNASALASKTISGAQASGLTYSSTNAAAETITLGSAKDSVTLGASTQGAADTVTGLTLVDDSAVAGTQIDLTKSDAIQINDSGAVNVAGFAKTTTTAASLNLALIDLAASATNALVFTFGGDTYAYVDTDAAGSAAGANGVVDAADLLVKITGTVDLDLLVGALNA